MDGKQSIERPSSGAAPRPRAAPKVRALSCPSCGAPLTVRGLLQTESIACGACGSVIDLADANLQVISTFQTNALLQPLIPLGARGKLLGDPFEVIGFMRRQITVEGVDYQWSEYLLFNPYKGFRWLTEYTGHWTFVRTLTERPIGDAQPRYMNRTFQHFQTSRAKVTYVLGEFYWRVQVGEAANVDDYVSPPYLLSRERSEKESVWSLGQYIDPEVIRAAFAVKTPLPPRVGVYSCQPAPYRAAATSIYRLFGWLLVGAVFIQLIAGFLSQNKLVYRGDFAYRPASGEKSFVTDVFDVPGRASNLVVKSHADVSNSWLYLGLALINDETGQAYDFGREISYYSGRDSDGSWSEGGRDDQAALPAVPAGRYYLRIEPENPGDAVAYSIRVYRDVPRWSFFVLAVLGLLLLPGWLFWRQRYFEIQRWAESDHPIITYSSDDN
jgi:hypothetical protein